MENRQDQTAVSAICSFVNFIEEWFCVFHHFVFTFHISWNIFSVQRKSFQSFDNSNFLYEVVILVIVVIDIGRSKIWIFLTKSNLQKYGMPRNFLNLKFLLKYSFIYAAHHSIKLVLSWTRPYIDYLTFSVISVFLHIVFRFSFLAIILFPLGFLFQLLLQLFRIFWSHFIYISSV